MSGAGGTSGTASGTSSSLTCTSTGGLPLNAAYLASPGNPGAGGYVYAFSDAGGSAATIGVTQFCGCGTNVAQNPPTYSDFGGGIGVNVNQDQAVGLDGGASMPEPFAATGTGLSYALTSVPAAGLRVQIYTSDMGPTVPYCVEATEAIATIPWTMFNTKCQDSPSDGVAPSGAPADLTKIEFLVPAVASAESWDFCVTQVGFQ